MSFSTEQALQIACLSVDLLQALLLVTPLLCKEMLLSLQRYCGVLDLCEFLSDQIRLLQDLVNLLNVVNLIRRVRGGC